MGVVLINIIYKCDWACPFRLSKALNRFGRVVSVYRVGMGQVDREGEGSKNQQLG